MWVDDRRSGAGELNSYLMIDGAEEEEEATREWGRRARKVHKVARQVPHPR